MNKILSTLLIATISTSLFACTAETSEEETTQEETTQEETTQKETAQEETITINNFGEEITITPSEEDWCGENCVIYPKNGNTFIRVPESGSETFFPEGSDQMCFHFLDKLHDFLHTNLLLKE